MKREFKDPTLNQLIGAWLNVVDEPMTNALCSSIRNAIASGGSSFTIEQTVSDGNKGRIQGERRDGVLHVTVEYVTTN